MIKLIRYLWHRYITKKAFRVITSYRLDVGMIMKFDSKASQAKIIWRGKKADYQNHWMIPYTEVPTHTVDNYITYKLGIWR